MPTVKKKPSLDFSLVGLIYTSMMLFMCLAAMNSKANLLYGVFGLMIGVLLVSGALSRLGLRKLEIRRSLPEAIVVGQPAVFQYEFHNQKRFWPSLSVTVGELSGVEAFAKQPQAYLLHAAAGTKATVPMQVLATRRGLHELELYQLSTSFPFGFIKRAIRRRQKDTVLVYPAIAAVDERLFSECLSAELSGARIKPRRGGSDEFFGVKEYRQGENPRWIYWRRTARTGTLVAKEMTQVAPPRLLLLVDTFLQEQTSAERAAVERTIAMAGSLVTSSVDRGLIVGLCVWSGGWVAVPGSRGKRHARDLMAVLARLQENVTADSRMLLDKGRRLMRSGTTTIVLTPHEVERSLMDQARGNWLVIGAGSEQARRWFRFAGEVDFEHCMPPQQEATAGR